MRCERVPFLAGILKVCELLDPGQQLLSKAVIIHLRARAPDNKELLAQAVLAVEVEQGGYQLALRQVTGSAKDDDGERFGRVGRLRHGFVLPLQERPVGRSVYGLQRY